MNEQKKIITVGFFITTLLFTAYSLKAQKEFVTQEALQIQILKMDSLLFDIGFNKCDVETRNNIIKEGFEFYDDREGLNKSYKSLNESFTKRCSDKVKIKRELISTEIFPLNYYGAVQFGIHRFYIDGVIKDTAKFIHVWKEHYSTWILTRIISYDHSHADYSIESDIENEIHQMDSLLFQVGFNQCDVEVIKSIRVQGQEFYDDRQGLNIFQEIDIESFLRRCSNKITRQLVSHEIYTIKNYGALQIGEHQFYEDGILDENAKFVHLWKKVNGKWVIPRVISYEHMSVRK